MYEAHFGLSPRPFAESVHPSIFVSLPSREAALRRLRYGLEGGPGPAALFGPSGTGKTLLVSRLSQERGGPVIHLTYPAMPAPELMAFLAEEMGCAPDPVPGLAGSVRRLRTRLSSLAEDRRKPLLIVDEAHLIEDPATFEALRLLLNFASDGTPDLDLLFAGGPEMTLQMPTTLTERFSARCGIGALSPDESAAYILGRLARAGARSPLFDPPSLAALHLAADGIPRRLNRLADLALLIAFARDRDRPDRETITIAEREAAFDLAA